MTMLVSRRPKSSYRAVSDRGRSFGLVLTDLDRQRIEVLGRWHALTVEHLARAEMPAEHWNPSYRDGADDPVSEEFLKHATGIRRRLSKLARINVAGSRSGPLVASELTYGGQTVWYATPHGATATDLAWPGKHRILPQMAAHAGTAADIGQQIEALGYRVLSEREITTGLDRHGAMIETPLESTVIGAEGEQVGKKPDLAVISGDERTFLAIEVERRKSRALSVYTEKLRAYDDNPAVGHVWYLCASENVANRVAIAADKVFGDRDFPLRIRVLEPHHTWYGIRGLETDERLLSDLEAYRPNTWPSPRRGLMLRPLR